MQRRGIQLSNRIEHEPHQMITAEPIRHIRRQQKLLITQNRSIPLGHHHILGNQPRHNAPTRSIKMQQPLDAENRAQITLWAGW